MKRMTMWRRAMAWSAGGLLVAGVVSAAVPNSFSAGEVLSAQKLNDNFAELTAAVKAATPPPGTIIAYGGVVSDATPAPAGWLPCDGTQVDRAMYADLFAAVGTAWGNGNGTTTFNVPDLRGRFLRGNDAGSARDPDRGGRGSSNNGGNSGDNVGTVQGDDFRSHAHGYHAVFTIAADQSNPNHYNQTGAFSFVLKDNTSYNAGGNETRPQNASVNYLIKY